jgi:hypothetical protein
LSTSWYHQVPLLLVDTIDAKEIRTQIRDEPSRQQHVAGEVDVALPEAQRGLTPSIFLATQAANQAR